MKRQFIMVVMKENPLTRYNFADLFHDDRIIILDGWVHEARNKLLRFLKKIHFSRKINKIIDLPLKHLWGYTLDDIERRDDTQYYVIAVNFCQVDIKYLQKKREELPIKYVLFSQDAWDDRRYSSINRYYDEKLHFDMIFTIDNADANKYGFIYSDHHYSMLLDSEPVKIKYDLYYIGVNKGRYQKLLDIFSVLKSGGISMYYRIADVPRAERKYQEDIIYASYKDRISYPEVVNGVKAANCILEVLIDIQSGATLRYYEAVCYNKKLLTNNKNVVNLPFYNPEYIHVFEKPEDIDWNWVKERIPVDYHYDGRFSPTHLIDRIIELEEQKEAQAGEEKK